MSKLRDTQASVVALRDPEPERDDSLPRRSLPPVHYEAKIDTVTKLLKLDTYKFGFFEAGGYEWSLRLLPRGHTDREGKKHMSLYLSMEKPNKLGNRRVLVDYKFFVRDNNSGTYVIFQEKEKELRAFTKEATEWGFSKFLSLETFKNPKNGYSKDDYCIFGAEVMVSESKSKKETLTIAVKDPPQKTTIQHFSTSNKQPQRSKPFKVGGWDWNLEVFLQSNGAQQEGSLSVYLQAPGLRLRPEIKMYVEANLRVLNKSDSKNNKKNKVSGWLSANNYECGQPDFMPRKDLEKTKGFINKEELEFEVEILNLSNAEKRN